MNKTYTGGCQCGAVRFRIDGPIKHASVCHCRMCQKAFSSFYVPFASVRGLKLTWTRGEPKKFRSSNVVERGFCGNCGTPLTYEAPDGIAIAIGAFDEPAAVTPPATQWGIEAKLPYTDTIPGLPAKNTLADSDAAHFLSNIRSYQHPDHDTQSWPPPE